MLLEVFEQAGELWFFIGRTLLFVAEHCQIQQEINQFKGFLVIAVFKRIFPPARTEE